MVSMTYFSMVRKTALLKDFSNLTTLALPLNHLARLADLPDTQHVKAQ